MKALLPDPTAEVDVLDAYDVPTGRDGRPFVRCNMISTLDGAITVGGRSGEIGGPADQRLFALLRSLADVILVGAGTVRAEGYGPARMGPERRRQRRARGQAEVPPIAVVTGSANLDWSSPFFTEAEARPVVVTTSEGRARCALRAEPVAEVVVAGDDRVDPVVALDRLVDAGHRSVLLEGGPALNADVVEAGLLDELCLTLAPRLVAGSGPRVLAGPELPSPLDLEVVHLLEEDGFLFYRLATTASYRSRRLERRAAG
ncbi:MAG TPA: pyrimidine reductase family protein, partial [Acidimicrobiales bacterium]|nr:pyrimidine reductase family protein [Acidimicrobiales bacterium]